MTRAQASVLEQMKSGLVLYEVKGYGHRLEQPFPADPRPVPRRVVNSLVQSGSIRRVRCGSGKTRRYALMGVAHE